MTRTPATLYRYRQFSINTLEMLCHDRLHFGHPGSFNDPMDCSPSVECDSSIEELKALLSELIRRRVKSEVLSSLRRARLKGQNALAHADKRAEVEAQSELSEIAYNSKDPFYTEYVTPAEVQKGLTIRQIETELRRYYDRGVCCFSTSYASPLLWSHYGDQHQGLCIGYSLNRRPQPNPQRVIYGGKRSIRTSSLIRALVHGDLQAVKELDRDVLLRKARGWGYEKEWRLIGRQGDQESPLLLKQVIFGLRCPLTVMHAVIRALEGRMKPVSYYRMYEVSGRYVLRRRAVDLDEFEGMLPLTAVSSADVFGDNYQ
jgi:hypothetical protein